MFSKNGIKATTVEQIANAVGIRAPSLYKHFKNKQEIIDSIIGELEARYKKRLEIESEVIKNSYYNTQKTFESNFDKVLFYVQETVNKLVDYTLNDDFMNKSAMLMKVEQYRTDAIALNIDKEFCLRLINPFKETFKRLCEEKILKKMDFTLMALQFLAPIDMLIDSCRREAQEEKIEEYKRMINAHVEQFFKVYKLS